MSQPPLPFADSNGVIPGQAVPVALVGDVFATYLTMAAQSNAVGADLVLNGGISINPLDLFHSYSPFPNKSGIYGVAVMIVNSLSTPLTLVDTYGYEDRINYANMNGPLYGYPATIDPSNQAVSKQHQIPFVRPYPIPSKHKTSHSLTGVGLYRFQSDFVDWPTQVNRGLAFAATKDGSNAPPLIGVGFTFWRKDDSSTSPITLTCAVSADITDEGHSDTKSNLTSLIEGPDAYYDQVGDCRIFGCFATVTPAYEPNIATLLVWVSPSSPIVPPNIGQPGGGGGGN